MSLVPTFWPYFDISSYIFLCLILVRALHKKFAIGPFVKSMLKKKAKLTVCHVDQFLHTTWHTKRQFSKLKYCKVLVLIPTLSTFFILVPKPFIIIIIIFKNLPIILLCFSIILFISFIRIAHDTHVFYKYHFYNKLFTYDWHSIVGYFFFCQLV